MQPRLVGVGVGVGASAAAGPMSGASSSSDVEVEVETERPPSATVPDAEAAEEEDMAGRLKATADNERGLPLLPPKTSGPPPAATTAPDEEEGNVTVGGRSAATAAVASKVEDKKEVGADVLALEAKLSLIRDRAAALKCNMDVRRSEISRSRRRSRPPTLSTTAKAAPGPRGERSSSSGKRRGRRWERARAARRRSWDPSLETIMTTAKAMWRDRKSVV